MNLHGARALVTGSSGGLGEAVARALCAKGAHVVVTGRNEQALQALARDIAGEYVIADLARRAEANRLVEAAGDIDVLVSKAALPAGGRVASFTPDEIERPLQVNLAAPILLSRLLTEPMAARRRGHVVFVSSLAAAFPTPGLAVYNATKAALASYGLSLRGELAPLGVGVSVVYPGPIRGAVR